MSRLLRLTVLISSESLLLNPLKRSEMTLLINISTAVTPSTSHSPGGMTHVQIKSSFQSGLHLKPILFPKFSPNAPSAFHKTNPSEATKQVFRACGIHSNSTQTYKVVSEKRLDSETRRKKIPLRFLKETEGKKTLIFSHNQQNYTHVSVISVCG